MRLYQNQPSGMVARLKAARRNPTEAEAKLLRALREALPQYKWRFQAPVGAFRVDFMCFAERLVIEVDGATHAEAESYDAARTAIIEREGYRVLRFWNNDVMANTEGAIAKVAEALQTPSPIGRGKVPARGARGKGEGDEILGAGRRK